MGPMGPMGPQGPPGAPGGPQGPPRGPPGPPRALALALALFVALNRGIVVNPKEKAYRKLGILQTGQTGLFTPVSHMRLGGPYLLVTFPGKSIL